MIKPGNSLTRNASDPYTIPLNDYILKDEELNKHMLLKHGGWFLPSLKLLSFKDKTAAFKNSSGEISYKLIIKVEKDCLHVSCSCATPVATLCIHAYKALEKLMLFGKETHYFKNFRPNGIAETAFAHKQYFDIEDKPQGPMYKAKEWLGSIYGLDEKLKGHHLDDVLSLPTPLEQDVSEGKGPIICYMLMIARWNDLLPFLLPCLGKQNKYRDDIRNFYNFLSGTDKAYEPFLTEEQKALNVICLKIWQLVEKMPGEMIHKDMLSANSQKLKEVFELWQKAVPLLENQLVYKHPYFQKKQLKKKPARAWSYHIKLQKDKPELRFQLADRGAFYQLTIQFFIKGTYCKNCEMIDEFFVENRGKGNVYMLSSLRDAGVAAWMVRSQNKITVFKKHFAAFEENFLKPLQKYYTVKVVRRSLKNHLS